LWYVFTKQSNNVTTHLNTIKKKKRNNTRQITTGATTMLSDAGRTDVVNAD